MEEEPVKLFKRGLKLLRRGYPEDAVVCFSKIVDMNYDSAACYSWLGLAIARSKYGDIAKAEQYCRKAVKKAFYQPRYYVNLAEVYILWGKKRRAVDALESCLKLDDGNIGARRKLTSMGLRKRPVIPFLSRSNPLNKYLGIILTRLGIRR